MDLSITKNFAEFSDIWRTFRKEYSGITSAYCSSQRSCNDKQQARVKLQMASKTQTKVVTNSFQYFALVKLNKRTRVCKMTNYYRLRMKNPVWWRALWAF